ncbi:MAG: PadR family transcriptional regulator [Proteobacteria bacterium]|nr:PadR family transcriptional regulator [Pseudomonadota bacterium]MBS0572194.1 PadR family transcriptional regulator [Pseudomonadota bacterium]
MRISMLALRVLSLMAADVRSARSGADIGRTLKISSGSLYPLLAKLEKDGLVRSSWEDGDPSVLGRPRRRFYQISGLGFNVAQAELAAFAKPAWALQEEQAR